MANLPVAHRRVHPLVSQMISSPRAGPPLRSSASALEAQSRRRKEARGCAGSNCIKRLDRLRVLSSFGVEHIDPIRNPRRLNAMTLWHQTGDAPCRVSFGDGAWWLDLEIGTLPVEAGQSVSIEAMVSDDEERVRPAIFCEARLEANNKGGNSYWNARIGPFKAGDNVEYSLKGRVPQNGPKLYTTNVLYAISRPPKTLARHPLASASADVSPLRTLRRQGQLHAALGATTLHSRLLLHGGVAHLLPECSSHHQSDPGAVAPNRSLCRRRMHRSGARLTLTPASELTAGDREYIAMQFFDADWHHEIYPHARYKELLEKRGRGRPLNDSDITDLRMWFNLAWFGPEFQVGEVFLPDGTTASVRRFVEKGSEFSEDEIKAMVALAVQDHAQRRGDSQEIARRRAARSIRQRRSTPPNLFP